MKKVDNKNNGINKIGVMSETITHNKWKKRIINFLSGVAMIVIAIVLANVIIDSNRDTLEDLNLGCDANSISIGTCMVTDGDYIYKIYSNGDITSWSKTDLDQYNQDINK